jgi:hypothetical protein
LLLSSFMEIRSAMFGAINAGRVGEIERHIVG